MATYINNGSVEVDKMYISIEDVLSPQLILHSYFRFAPAGRSAILVADILVLAVPYLKRTTQERETDRVGEIDPLDADVFDMLGLQVLQGD
ncbi:hypothetical protein A0H81_07450 [Grifola frondosa]|uniref:Uncharacterized protein n=1 Tax=Grifola frondosa TaxID=5627 RepID=A0A1C7M6M3_GRIFR|nr:hypothetical protein A0H81_07450 [Grifola frondosa]